MERLLFPSFSLETICFPSLSQLTLWGVAQSVWHQLFQIRQTAPVKICYTQQGGCEYSIKHIKLQVKHSPKPKFLVVIFNFSCLEGMHRNLKPPRCFSTNILRDSLSCNMISGPGLQPALSHLLLLRRKTIKVYVLTIKETTHPCTG